MKTGKEYPATHSMSTAWYIVDDDGNIGIMDYDENGPVPLGTEETCTEELVYGHWEDWRRGKITRFDLTDEQVMALLANPHSPSEEKSWCQCVVRIDKDRKERFLQLCDCRGIARNYVFCLSESLGLYGLDAYSCTHDRNYRHVPIFGPLKTMLDEGIILEVYDETDYYIEDDLTDDGVVIEKEFSDSPYYIFKQPYVNSRLPVKVHVPDHPVRIEQVPREFRDRILRIPGSFKEMDSFQIAEYYPCSANGNDLPSYVVDGKTYLMLPMSDGHMVYIDTETRHIITAEEMDDLIKKGLAHINPYWV